MSQGPHNVLPVLTSDAPGTLLDILEQLKDLSFKSDSGDLIRAQMLQKVDRIESAIGQFPTIIYRLEQHEKRLSEISADVKTNSEFRIKSETGATLRRTYFGVVAGIFGGVGGAFLTFVLSKLAGK